MGFVSVEIDNCTFSKNYGLNIGNGAALVIDGKQSLEFQKFMKPQEA